MSTGRRTADDFDEFRRAEYVGLVRLVTGLIGDDRTAQTLVDDVFVRLQPRWSTLSGPPLPEVRLEALNAGRNELRRRRLAVPGSVDEPEFESGSARETVAGLSDRQREVVVLLHVVGLSPAETAAMLGLRPAAVTGIDRKVAADDLAAEIAAAIPDALTPPPMTPLEPDEDADHDDEEVVRIRVHTPVWPFAVAAVVAVLAVVVILWVRPEPTGTGTTPSSTTQTTSSLSAPDTADTGAD